MIFPTHHLLTAALALVLVTAPSGARAQEVVQPLPGTTDADRLGDTMRQLASNPRNVDALVRAGDLSIGLGDLSGAAALFARAEKVDPRNGRVKAGMASILVRSERPGEALRYFAQAEAFGLQPRYYAADRGLAYDLIGEQDRAQRDYRVALRDAPDDETVRRYALSLGISGKRDLALQQLDPLVLKKDRGAWRARAFILAMNNDVRGAETIVTTMMPGAAARGLQPFFQRLPLLAPADRAFAVHFGEVHATPQRIADARMTPVLPQLGADPTAPVMLAAAEPQPAPQPTGRAKAVADRSATRRDKTARSGRVEVAAVTPTPTPTPTPPPVRPTATVQASAPMVMVQPLPKSPVVMASTQPVQRPTGPAAATTLAPSAPTSTFVQPLPARTTSGAAADANRVSQASVAASTPTRAPDTPGALPSAIVAQMAALPTAPATSAGTTPPVMPRTTTAPVSTAVPTTPAAAGVVTTTVPTTTPAAVPGIASTPTQVAVAATPAATPRTIPVSEDSILARIIAGLSIPASELGVAPIARAAPVVPASPSGVGAGDDAGARALADAKAKAERDTAAEAEALAATRLADAKAARAKLAADKKIADRKAIADKKLAAEKKAAVEKKAIADKAAAEQKRIARANPERIWVQVSTGATEGDLPKAWKGVKAKAPTVVGTRGGWTAPWGATNRVLAGPFKTAAEARAFVNALAKEGVSTFSFTSDAGQVVTKLPAK